MPKPMMYTQERMPESVVPIAKKEGFDSFREFFDSEFVTFDRKISVAWKIAHLVTLNGFKKDDLQAMLKWVMEENYKCGK